MFRPKGTIKVSFCATSIILLFLTQNDSMEGIKIESVNLIGSNDSGSTYELQKLQPEGYLLAYRKKGSISGNHYHEGKSKGKSPEKLLLISGKANIYGKNISTNEEFNKNVEAPVFIKISPMIIHTVTALTDISFIEFNSLDEHKNDTIYP